MKKAEWKGLKKKITRKGFILVTWHSLVKVIEQGKKDFVWVCPFVWSIFIYLCLKSLCAVNVDLLLGILNDCQHAYIVVLVAWWYKCTDNDPNTVNCCCWFVLTFFCTQSNSPRTSRKKTWSSLAFLPTSLELRNQAPTHRSRPLPHPTMVSSRHFILCPRLMWMELMLILCTRSSRRLLQRPSFQPLEEMRSSGILVNPNLLWALPLDCETLKYQYWKYQQIHMHMHAVWSQKDFLKNVWFCFIAIYLQYSKFWNLFPWAASVL